MKQRTIGALALVAALCALAPPAVWGQAVSGSQITGTIRDVSGAVIPGATVMVIKTDTGMTRSAVTGSDGTYVLTNLPVGPYQLRVQLDGFNTYVRDGIVLQVNSNPTIDVALVVGLIAEQVTVTADSPMVEARATGIGQIIDHQRVVEMPLNGRQATELIFLSGLATSAPAQDLNTNKNYPTVTISVAGGQANGMTYIMDGGTHNDPFNNLNLPTPMPDALQEFKVETSSLPARYGHHAASAVNVVTKSGTNRLRGNAFEFLRNVQFNEKNYFSAAKDQLKRNQFGGTLGGPITRDKVFFFGAYQGKIEKSSPPETFSFVPTPAMLSGDFTTVASAACRTTPITLSAAQGFVNNQIDPARFNPVALAFLKYVPVSSEQCGRLVYGIPNNSTEHQTLGKVDLALNQHQSLFGRYLYAVYDNPGTYDGKSVLTLSRTGQNNQAHSFVVGHTWVVSASTVAALHATYNKTLNDRTIPEYFSPADLGSKVYSPQPGFTGVNVTGGFAIGQGATNPGYFNSDTVQVAEDIDMVLGQHQLAFGANWIHNKIETLNNRPTNGQFTFNGQGTGLGMADFMLGLVSGGFLQGNPVYDFDNNDYFGAYVQDEWRIHPNITLSAGLRWEPYLPLKNTLGYVSHFDQSRFDQGLKSQVYPLAPAGLIFPGDSGYPGKATTFGDTWQFAPRTGVVWSPDERTAVKASYGMFYDTPHLFFNTRFANNPPWGAQLTLPNPAGGFTDPYLGYPGGNPWPALATQWQTAAFPAFGVYVNTPLHTKRTALHQWNIGLQRQIGDWLLAGSYLGNRSVHLWRATELNPAIFGPGATTGNLNNRRVLIQKNPVQGQFYGTIGQLDDTGQASYHGMLLSVNRRLKANVSMLANYTLSRCMSDPATTELTGPTIVDPNNPDLDYAYCAADRRHVTNISAVIRTPRFTNTTMDAIFGNWSFAPILRWQTGNRTSVTTGVDNALSGMPNQRAVQVAGVDPYGTGEPTVDANGIGVYRGYLNRDAFTSPASGTYSNLKPFTIVNPGVFQNDLAISRAFKFADRSLQFRWEIFNVINHVNFNAPIAALNNANFGSIQSAGDPRIMQFALKFDF